MPGCAVPVKRPADTKADDAFSKKLRPATDDDTLAVRDILSRERTIEDRRTCLSSKGTGKGFENVRKIGLALIEKLSSGVPIGPSAGGSSSSSKPGPPTSRSAPAPARPGTSSSSAAKGGQQRVYVILPSSTSSMLQLYNANAFFNEKTFVPVTPELVQSMSKPQFVDVRRTKADGTPIVFRFIDSAVSLKAEEWPKVVAVFAQGQKWQFSHFRWREPTDVFHNSRFRLFNPTVDHADRAVKREVSSLNTRTKPSKNPLKIGTL